MYLSSNNNVRTFANDEIEDFYVEGQGWKEGPSWTKFVEKHTDKVLIEQVKEDFLALGSNPSAPEIKNFLSQFPDFSKALEVAAVQVAPVAPYYASANERTYVNLSWHWSGEYQLALRLGQGAWGFGAEGSLLEAIPVEREVAVEAFKS